MFNLEVMMQALNEVGVGKDNKYLMEWRNGANPKHPIPPPEKTTHRGSSMVSQTGIFSHKNEMHSGFGNLDDLRFDLYRYVDLYLEEVQSTRNRLIEFREGHAEFLNYTINRGSPFGVNVNYEYTKNPTHKLTTYNKNKALYAEYLELRPKCEEIYHRLMSEEDPDVVHDTRKMINDKIAYLVSLEKELM